MATRTLALPEVDLVHGVAGPLPTADGRPPLLMVGQPMTAEGFHALAGHLPERRVVTYDPRGLGRSSVRRDDPLLSHRAIELLRCRVDADALRAAPTRVVIAVGEESANEFPGRCGAATARLLGQEPTVFPSHHGGSGAAEGPWPGQATAFAARLRGVLEGAGAQPSPVPATPRRQ